MKNIQVILHGDRIEVGEYNSRLIKDKVTENGSPIRGHICFDLPESRQQRKFLHGALIPLWCYYDNNDYKDSEVLERYFDDFMLENFPEVLKIHGKVKTFGKSSKGSAMLNKVTERIIDMLVADYGLEYTSPALLPATFIEWRDELASFSNEHFLEYMERMKMIDKTKML